MSDAVIQFAHVSKKFARGEQQTTLRDFIPAMLGRLFGRAQDAAALGSKEFWAVDDVSFEVHKGEALGIIGPNGSGKSTILKLLSGIIRPDKGTYCVQGRLSALIEVGAGFHPDLTGRENVYLNGCILGMTRKEVRAKFNQIVEFAGVEEFIDTPVKRYSSGMAVRLGFAVSAFVEPDVLLVDEVLAVGDAEFRNRCARRMERMRRDGVTMILVSHNLGEVRNLCERTVMLFKGQKVMEGSTQKVIEQYHKTVSEKIDLERQLEEARRGLAARPAGSIPAVEIPRVELLDNRGAPSETFMTGEPMVVRVHYRANKPIARPSISVAMMWAADDWEAAMFGSKPDRMDLGPLEGEGWIDLKIDSLLVEPNVYHFNVAIADEALGAGAEALATINNVRMVVSESEHTPIPAIFGLPHRWNCSQLQVPTESEIVSARV